MALTMVADRVLPFEAVGTSVDGAMTAEEALTRAQLDWEVNKHPLYVMLDEEPQELPDKFAMVRDVDRKVLGLVGSNYVPLQNREAFTFFDNLVDSGEAKYETAGMLRGGRVIWLLARMPEDVVIGGIDVVNTYLLLTTSHDGTKAVTAAVTPIRVVCMNTLNLALSTTQRSWAVRHLSTMEGRLQEAREALQLSFTYTQHFGLMGEHLLDQKVTDAKFAKLVEQLAPSERMRNELIDVWATSETLGETRGTAWGALNAVGEYFEWARPRTDAGRLSSTLYGRAALMRDHALALLS